MRTTDAARTRSRGEPGFVLAAALFALLVISALAAGTFFAALQELRVGRNAGAAEAAFEAAEAGLVRAMAEGRTGAWSGSAVGDSVMGAGALPGGTGRFAYTAQRLSDRLFLVRSSGSDAAGDARREVARLARRADLAAGFRAALTATGAVELAAGALLDGRDTAPAGWEGCDAAAADSVAAVAVPSSSYLRADPSCAEGVCLVGEPSVLVDTSLGDSASLRIGDLDWHDLERHADRVYPSEDGGGELLPAPVAVGAACDRSSPANWGEPARPAAVAACRNYFPLVFSRGDLVLSGGRGQGVLVVGGDLTVTGGTEFFGVVLVRGAVRFSGAGGRLLGAVVAGGGGTGVAAHLEGGSVAFSGCAVAFALARLGPVHPIRGRSWALLY